MSNSPPGSPRRQSEISSLRGAEPKRKPRGKAKRSASPDKTLPFFEQDSFTDVTIMVGDKSLYSNQCLLSYNSSEFMKTLSDNNAGKGKTKSTGSKTLDLSKHNLKDVVDLMCVIDPRVPYDLTDDVAMRLLPLAEEYDIAPLKKSCSWTVTESFYKKKKGRRAGHVPSSETIRYLCLADKYKINDLHQMCCDELVANDDPTIARAIVNQEDMSETTKRQVMEKKFDKVSLALARERRKNTEKDQPKDTRGSHIWKK